MLVPTMTHRFNRNHIEFFTVTYFFILIWFAVTSTIGTNIIKWRLYGLQGDPTMMT